MRGTRSAVSSGIELIENEAVLDWSARNCWNKSVSSAEVTGIVRNNKCCARVEEIGGIKPVSSAEVT
jgi:hypothetical protein